MFRVWTELSSQEWSFTCCLRNVISDIMEMLEKLTAIDPNAWVSLTTQGNRNISFRSPKFQVCDSTTDANQHAWLAFNFSRLHVHKSSIYWRNGILFGRPACVPNYLYMYSHHWDLYVYQIASSVPWQVRACHASHSYLPWLIFESNFQRSFPLCRFLFQFCQRNALVKLHTVCLASDRD